MSRQVVRDPAAVTEVLRRHSDFVATNALTSVVTLHPATLHPASLHALSRVGVALPPLLASATGQQRRTVRRRVARFFTPEKAADIRASVIALTRAHCLSVAEQLVTGSADLRTVAYPAPPAIMSELIGLPLSDLRLLKRWTQNSLELYWGWPDPARQFELATSASEFYCWLRNQIASAAGDDSLFVESGWCPLLSFRAPRTAEVTWS